MPASLTTSSHAETTNLETAKDVANVLSTVSTNSPSETPTFATEQEQPVAILIPERHSTPSTSNPTNNAVTHNLPNHRLITVPTPSKQSSQTIEQSRCSSEPVYDPPQDTRRNLSEQAHKPSQGGQRSSTLTRHSPSPLLQVAVRKRSQNAPEVPRTSKRARRSPVQANESSNKIQGQPSEEAERSSPEQPHSTDQRPSAQKEDAGEGASFTKRRKATGKSKPSTRKRGKAAISTNGAKTRKRKSQEQGTREMRKSQRSSTPEDAENITIEEDIIRMQELCSERRTGRKSVRSREIQVFEAAEAERRAAAKARQLAGEEPLEPEDQTVAAAADWEHEGSTLAPQTQIINGEIVLIEESTRIDRHAMADAQREAEAVIIVEENALTTRINSHYNLKKTPVQRWTDDDTEEFYNALRMFGTDFEIISKMFPTRSRRAVKLKYTHEEKVNQARISQTLRGERIPVDIEEFSEWTETTYADPAILHAEMETDRRVLEEEQAKEKELMEEARRQREAETAAEAAVAGVDTSAKENEDQNPSGTTTKNRKMVKRGEAKAQKGKKSQTRKGRKLPNIGGGQVEVLGRIEDNVHHQPKVPTP